MNASAARPIEECLEDVRPSAVAMDRSLAACTDPELLREGALERYGDVQVQTEVLAQSQCNSEYFSMILPFVIPRMVSGPDYTGRDRWRRTFDDAPLVDVQTG